MQFEAEKANDCYVCRIMYGVLCAFHCCQLIYFVLILADLVPFHSYHQAEHWQRHERASSLQHSGEEQPQRAAHLHLGLAPPLDAGPLLAALDLISCDATKAEEAPKI